MPETTEKHVANEKPVKKSAKKTAAKTTAPKINTQLSKNFYSDLKKEGMLFAKIIRSPKKSGILKNIEAADLPEGYFLIDAKNFPGKNSIETLGTTTEIFCSEKISYEGQSLALLAGPDKKMLETLAANIKIEIESVPAEKEKKLLSQKHIIVGGGKQKNIAKFFNRASLTTVRSKYIYKLDSAPSNEPNGALCFFEKDTLAIYTPTQWPRHLTENLKAVFNIAQEKISIHRTLSSASPTTNSLWGNTLLVCQICAAVVISKKPVMLQLSRGEQDRIFSDSGEVSITHKTALTEEGVIKAASIDIDVDAGAFNPFAQEIIDRLTIAASNIYNFENFEIIAQSFASNKPPASINIDTIDAAAFYAMENQMQRISSQTSFSPEEIRFANSKILNNEKSKMPFVLNIEGAKEALNGVIKQSDFSRKFVTYKINSEQSREKTINYRAYNTEPRGIALSCAYDASGYYGTSIFECDQKIQATLQKDGTLIIHAPSPNTTVLEIWKNTAAEILQIDPKKVKVNSEFSQKEEPLIPENFYSNLSIMTSLLKKCCQAIQLKKQKERLPISASKGITKAQINQWNKTRFRGVPFNSTSFVAIVLELRIDPCTFAAKISKIWVAVSAGKILAAKEAQSRIKFSIQKTLAEIMENERLEAKNISVSFVASESESSQIGGLIKKALPAAFSAALSQALNCNENFLPLKSDSLYNLVAQAQQAAVKKEGAQ